MQGWNSVSTSSKEMRGKNTSPRHFRQKSSLSTDKEVELLISSAFTETPITLMCI